MLLNGGTYTGSGDGAVNNEWANTNSFNVGMDTMLQMSGTFHGYPGIKLYEFLNGAEDAQLVFENRYHGFIDVATELMGKIGVIQDYVREIQSKMDAGFFHDVGILAAAKSLTTAGERHGEFLRIGLNNTLLAKCHGFNASATNLAMVGGGFTDNVEALHSFRMDGSVKSIKDSLVVCKYSFNAVNAVMSGVIARLRKEGKAWLNSNLVDAADGRFMSPVDTLKTTCEICIMRTNLGSAMMKGLHGRADWILDRMKNFCKDNGMRRAVSDRVKQEYLPVVIGGMMKAGNQGMSRFMRGGGGNVRAFS